MDNTLPSDCRVLSSEFLQKQSQSAPLNFYHHHFYCYLVFNNDSLTGCCNAENIKAESEPAVHSCYIFVCVKHAL